MIKVRNLRTGKIEEILGVWKDTEGKLWRLFDPYTGSPEAVIDEDLIEYDQVSDEDYQLVTLEEGYELI